MKDNYHLVGILDKYDDTFALLMMMESLSNIINILGPEELPRK